MKTALHWFRRDFRLTDNTALSACAGRADQVAPVYVLSDWRRNHRWTGPHRQAFLCGSLAELSASLESIGARLIIRRGDAVRELIALARECRAEAIFFNRDPDPFGRAVEAELERAGAAEGLEIVSCKDVCLHERDEVLTATGTPFRVFTPYATAWGKLPKPAPRGAPRSLSTPPGLASGGLPSLGTWGLKEHGNIVSPGEKAARERFQKFLGREFADYGQARDFPSEEATSRISQDLRFGLLSIREVMAKCGKHAESLPPARRANARKYLSELIWREFYMSVLWHHPEVLEVEFNPQFRDMAWPGKKEHFERWKDGETGFPIVDAAMRELRETGFMHNRARMITAMFLTKDLHLDWRLGESYFMQQLTDGEIANNNGGWQWSAGTGADAAPYFRIQNPWTQARRYDPRGGYIRKWIPELRDLPAELFFGPPKSGRLARKYPEPIVDHAAEREETLELFARQKKVADGRKG